MATTPGLLTGSEASNWMRSAPARHLIDVVHGPVDWTTTAALVGLACRARHDANCAPEVLRLFLELIRRPMTPILYMCAYQPAFQLLQHLPGLPQETMDVVKRRVHELESEKEEA